MAAKKSHIKLVSDSSAPVAERPYVPSVQQQGYFDWIGMGRGSAFVEAVAGAGKTTTLVQGVKIILEGAERQLSIAAAMYNKKAATDFTNKLAAKDITPQQCRAGTFHSFGFNAWRRIHPNVLVDDRVKWDRIANTLSLPRHLEAFAKDLVSLAKQAGIGAIVNAADKQVWWDLVEHHDLSEDLADPEAEALEGIRWAYKALKLSRDISDQVIDFDDMIYMPIATNCRVWQNDWLLVDEAQDTNPARRALARKMLKTGGRAVFVGDRHQAIYGFTGADNDAVDLIIKEFGCSQLPLTVTYRCPKIVVRAAQQYVSHIEAHESAPEGWERRIDEAQFASEQLRAKDAILCRNTAPLVKLAFHLIKSGTACHVEGKSIGEGLKKLAARWKTSNISVLMDAVKGYKEKQVSKLMSKGKETQAEALADRCDTLLVLCEGCATADAVRTKIDNLFQDDTPTLTLCTAHRSKGREWERVYIWGQNAYMPSKYARQDWQQDQELNLIYVAYTRAQSELVHVRVEVR